MRIDAHQHYWQVARGDYFWMSPAVEPLCRDFLPPELEPLLQAHGFVGSVVVQAAPTLSESVFLLELAARHPSILGVVGWVELESDSLRQDLARLSSNPKFVGVRPMLQDLPDDDWIAGPRVLAALAELTRADLALDLLVHERHLPAVGRALAAAPELRAVIDHCAKPNLRSTDLSAWKRKLAEVARASQVYCKLSGLVTEAPADFSASDLAPAVEHVLALFGEDRLLFGSDWPVCTLAASYERTLSVLIEILGNALSPGFEQKLFGGNARRLYQL